MDLSLRDVTKLLEKHNFNVRRAATKYNHTNTALVEAINREFTKQLFKFMDVKEVS